VLSGNNGNGKSALLDALTWAMWGKARHSDAHLLRIGANDMRVEFVFDLDGERYRVVRGWTKNKRGGTPLLEVNIADTESGLYRPLTRSSTRESQALLNGLLRMDYETFINSAYLKQGMADLFSRQMPGQRKQILAEILGLSRYQDIADRARTDARLSEAKVEQLEGRIEGIENFLQNRAEAQRLYEFYNRALEELKPQIATLQERVQELSTRKVRLEEKRKRADAVLGEIATEERKRDELQNLRGRLLAKKAELDEWQAQSDLIVGEYETWREAEAARRKWEAVAEQWNNLAEAARQLRDKIRELGADLEAQRADLQVQIQHENRVLESAQSQVERSSEVQHGAQLLDAAREEENQLAQTRAAYDRAERAARAAEDALRQARNSREVRLHQLETQIAECTIVDCAPR
jgi:exonuclease SbcC